MIIVSRRPAAGVVGGALLGAIVGMMSPTTSPVAYADSEAPSGPYQVMIDGGDDEIHAVMWNFSPCGADCSIANGAAAHDWKFHLSDERWTFNGRSYVECRDFDGTVSRPPVAVNASFDAATLVGQYQLTYLEPCGPLKLPLNPDFTFTMTKAD